MTRLATFEDALQTLIDAVQDRRYDDSIEAHVRVSALYREVEMLAVRYEACWPEERKAVA